MSSFIEEALKQSCETLNTFISDKNTALNLASAIDLMSESLKNGGKILSCGNGGSMCDSLHFVEELTGRYRKDRPAIAALGMGDGAHMSCVANDFGFDQVFQRNVDALGKSGDILLAISTSGNSQNILNACESAKKWGMKIVGLTGKSGGKLAATADVAIVVPSQMTDRIQEIHIKCIHIFIEGIERNLYPELYS
ncbi:MAG: D-sedoheptulose 7-phosphate isomerase [Bacteriovoracaceae bacterium]|jgi:D-sedoheptulose 7-phosphate isomerase|nr:D-sedoheptulose 7-phosphate isomerase [Bacteriovoracaceae bacterium]